VKRVFSNGDGRDLVLNQFTKRADRASRLYLAAPYFTKPEPVVNAARQGKSVHLLVGLNASTTPKALAAVRGIPGLHVRFLTHRFHAKIYVFDDDALLGSSNLTDAGLIENREAVICLDADRDPDAVDEVKALFQELWESAAVLTDEKFNKFRMAWEVVRTMQNQDDLIEDAIGRAEPANVNVASRSKTKVRAFLDSLQRDVYEKFSPAFNEVTQILLDGGFRRPELADIGLANETNRFLNWVRLSRVHGVEAWRNAPLRSDPERRVEIGQLGSEWLATDDNRVPDFYIGWLANVQSIFGSAEKLRSLSKDELVAGLMSLHAFTEQSRYVTGGMKNLPQAFWAANADDVEKVRRALLHLLYGSGDFVERLHDVLYDKKMSVNYFGWFSALELFGTVRPDECPPMNGRMAKALRYLGYDVPAV
jgi:hypothetical protein